jgi:hypothetical protein
MARRSRSHRPQKVRNSDAPAADLPAMEKVADTAYPPSREVPAAAPLDELAAVDAGWDEL